MEAEIEVVEPGHEIMTSDEQIEGMTAFLEQCGRVCYQSEAKGPPTAESSFRFVEAIVNRGHLSVAEHCAISVLVTCSRSCSHQLVRHRIGAYSQESQRYVEYRDGRLRVICPPSIGPLHPGVFRVGRVPTKNGVEERLLEVCPSGPEVSVLPNSAYEADGDKRHVTTLMSWVKAVTDAYSNYKALRTVGIPKEDARSVLPNATKTELVVTFNLRQWRHVFEQRAMNKSAQWEIREIMNGILDDFEEMIPAVFADLRKEKG